MTLVLVAHGTRDSAGNLIIRDIADAVRGRLPGVDVRTAFADVRSPNVTEALASVTGPAVVIPAFLAAGYHVRVDIPAQILASGHPDVTMSDPLGVDLVPVAHQRLVEAGWDGEPVIFGAAGSSDPHALADVRRAARLLAARTSTEVRIGYVATAKPRVADLLTRDSFVASWLLAPGAFHRQLTDLTSRVSAPIGPHEHVVDLVVDRYRSSKSPGGPVSGRAASQR
jgi:sirohydrochlorin ferrochelatase